ncbi:MAG TPA: TetR/AcrR family transcriptional regulator [Steroidobacteraceae bacterium]|jgi:AcrR family transcriptional regulator|nr:TetR/AcrR family transcriptional regulator [Steroidobacteraceae bacterium]
MVRPKQMQVIEDKEVISMVPKPRVRDRIMSAATDLFYRHGIHAVGVDAIANAAGTNKMSFYRNFASKDELVAEYLRGEEREGWFWWDETLAAHAGNPRLQVEALFDVLVKNTCEVDSRGCALANAAVEITEPGHPARPVIEKFKAEMRERFHELAHGMNAREPRALGDALMLLWEGAFLARVTMGEHGPVQGVANAARALIAAYTD